MTEMILPVVDSLPRLRITRQPLMQGPSPTRRYRDTNLLLLRTFSGRLQRAVAHVVPGAPLFSPFFMSS